MGKIFYLKKNYQFMRVYKRGRFFKGKYLILYVLRNHLNVNKMGISVSKKFGNSVKRNRIKRIIRESCRQYAECINQGYDLVFVVKNGDKLEVPEFWAVNKEVSFLLKKSVGTKYV